MSTDMSIDEKLDEVLHVLQKFGERMTNIEKRMATLTVKQAVSSSKVEPADDSDLDGQHGDPVVKKDPPKWTGDSFVGCKFSECSAEFLDNLAGFKMWQAGKEEAKEKAGDEAAGKKAWYARKDAARAAGWSRRIRDGYTPPVAENNNDDDGSVPF